MATVYEIVTDRIIKQIEAGVTPWKQPWVNVSPRMARSHTTGKYYSLLNQILLGRPGEYLTYKQALAEHGHVKKGAKGVPVVFWKRLGNDVTDEIDRDNDAEELETDGKRPAFVLRYYTVFHIDDCEGIERRYEVPAAPPKISIPEVDGIVDDYAARTALIITHAAQSQAYYTPANHSIVLPEQQQFDNVAEYYSTLFHELVHSTGHKKLLNRFSDKAKSAKFGSATYSKEELIAEIGASMLLTSTNVGTDDTLTNSAAYIKSWLKSLKDDPKLIVTAATRAEKAVKLILNQQEG